MSHDSQNLEAASLSLQFDEELVTGTIICCCGKISGSHAQVRGLSLRAFTSWKMLKISSIPESGIPYWWDQHWIMGFHQGT